MKMICIGRNYRAHAAELGNDVPAEPLFFLKPDSALLLHRHPFYIPDFTQSVHYEVEVVVRISRLGKAIAPEHAHRYYDAVTLGIDFTARDVQDRCKATGSPWEPAKAFDGSAVVSREWLAPEGLQDLHFHLLQNGKVVQQGHTADQIFPIDDVIAFVSRYMTLKVGDLIFTGTPAGVGPVQVGDVLEGFIGERRMFEVHVA
jgi:2-keto-4-pentenoate hydratase/2-oxohepta-3-ene-1,7-dioic acid hydratase in catechol pathway